MSGKYIEIEYSLENDPGNRAIVLSREEWDNLLKNLSEAQGKLQENDDSFYLTEIIHIQDNRLTAGVMKWEKIPFEN